ncbi:calmodulin-binding transcription activator 1-like isoform X7 [Lates japonicus]|uniref:Calmodulin-binding transcription activator 1-like isoform X7 n=1 Tax=Lates japonicus TaxID=270547 RepID=A0AAD3NKQ8_LATJO|nr:calmodulin-binding transcription activator 1-like isoform X7 [Lates japonicus]
MDFSAAASLRPSPESEPEAPILPKPLSLQASLRQARLQLQTNVSPPPHPACWVLRCYCPAQACICDATGSYGGEVISSSVVFGIYMLTSCPAIFSTRLAVLDAKHADSIDPELRSSNVDHFSPPTGQPAGHLDGQVERRARPAGISKQPHSNPNSELRRARTENQPDNHNQSWSQTGHRAPQGTQGEQGAPLQGTPFSHLQARIGGSGGGTRWSLRQTLGQRSLARRILGKERLAIHLRHRVLSDRGEETELLTYQDNTEDLQMDITMLADHIMEASTGRLKQEAMETETDSGKVGISSDVRLLSGYLGEVERFLNSKPQNPCPKPNSLSGPEDHQSPQAKQAPSSPFDWSSFLCAAMKEERLKADSSCLAMTEAEQGELYDTIRHALHSLRKHKGPIQEQRKEIAAVIQRCYKRYKQYALYKRMTLAAILIQSRFRSFHEQRKFQQSRRAAVLIQQYYRSYRHSLSSLLTKKQNQAARKILRFLLRCRHSPLMDHRPLKRGQRAEKGQGS